MGRMRMLTRGTSAVTSRPVSPPTRWRICTRSATPPFQGPFTQGEGHQERHQEEVERCQDRTGCQEGQGCQDQGGLPGSDRGPEGIDVAFVFSFRILILMK